MSKLKKISVLTFILSVIKPFRVFIAIQMVVGIVWAVDLAFRPFLIKTILNKTTLIHPSEAIQELGYLALVYTLCGIGLMLFLRLHDWAWLKMSAPLRKHITALLMDRMMNQSHHFYQNNFAGALTNKITDVAINVTKLIKMSLDAFYSHGLSVITSIIALSRVGSHFAFGMSVWIIFFIIISVTLSKRAAHLSNIVATKGTRVVGFIVDVLSNMMSVRLFLGKEQEKKLLNEKNSEFVTADQEAKRFYMIIHALQGTSFNIFQGVCLWWLIKGFQEGSVTAGDFALVFTITIHVVNNLWSLSKDIKDFSECLGIVTQGLTIIRAPIDVKDVPNAPDLIVTKGTIVFEKVQFHYKDAAPFFQDKSIIIPAGQKVGLVGPSGAGKSTFVSLILRQSEVNSGRILIDGQDIKMVTQDSLRRAIGIIPQESVLFHRTLMENIGYGKKDASKEEIIEAAKKAQAHEFIKELKDGYDTIVGERGSKLSGGQRQRIAIARAMLKDPRILIIDEATSQLDLMTEAHIQKSLASVMEGKTTIVIAHRVSTIAQMDRILVFERGKIIEDGNHQTLLERGGLYAALWNAQIGGILPASKK